MDLSGKKCIHILLENSIDLFCVRIILLGNLYEVIIICKGRSAFVRKMDRARLILSGRLIFHRLKRFGDLPAKGNQFFGSTAAQRLLLFASASVFFKTVGCFDQQFIQTTCL